MRNETILVVEDDKQIKKFICYALSTEGFTTIEAGNGQTALHLLVTEAIDVLLLDLGLPDIDGMEVLKKIREWSEVPVIVVSARDQDGEKVAALDAGADDYLTKPFSATELLARIRVALRHYVKIHKVSPQMEYHVGELHLDMDKHLVLLEGKEVHLTPMEYQLLCLFFQNAGKALTTAYLLKEIWGIGYGSDTQALRALMAGLRRKIEENPAKPKYILTEIGVGYRMADRN